MEACALLPKSCDFTLLVAGGGALTPEFERAAAQDSRIELLGYIQGDAKDGAFRRADCLMLPSLWYENAPVVIVEAAAYGLAVIGSDLGAIPEFVTQGKTGLLHAPGDAHALAGAMKQLVENPHQAWQFGKNAAPLLATSSVEHMANEYTTVYEDLMKKKKI